MNQFQTRRWREGEREREREGERERKSVQGAGRQTEKQAEREGERERDSERVKTKEFQGESCAPDRVGLRDKRLGDFNERPHLKLEPVPH